MAKIITSKGSGRGRTIEEKARAERLYVQEGVTALTKLEERTGISRQTLSKWKVDEDWDKKRQEYVLAPEELGDRLKKIIHQLLNEIDGKLAAKEFVSPLEVKKLESYVRALHRIDGMFYSKGMMMQWANAFLDFVIRQPQERELLTGLQRVMPQFLEQVERGN